MRRQGTSQELAASWGSGGAVGGKGIRYLGGRIHKAKILIGCGENGVWGCWAER